MPSKWIEKCTKHFVCSNRKSSSERLIESVRVRENDLSGKFISCCGVRSSKCKFGNRMQFTIKVALVSLAYLVSGISSSCDKSILPELTFRLGGTNLDWPCFSTKNIYASTGRYVPKHVIATRAQIYRDEAFVALPRYRSGVPFSLGVVSLKKGQCSTAIRPYPSWELQEEGNCNALQNVVDVFLDNQVWPQPLQIKRQKFGDENRNRLSLLSIHFAGHSVGAGHWHCEQFGPTSEALCTKSGCHWC